MRRIFVGAIPATAALWAVQMCGARNPVVFVDITPASGVGFQTASIAIAQKFLPESMVGAVAICDYDEL